MTSNEMKKAHLRAKRYQSENGGDYLVYLAYAMKKIWAEKKKIAAKKAARVIEVLVSISEATIRETEKALLVAVSFGRFDTEEWIPKSAIKGNQVADWFISKNFNNSKSFSLRKA
jgi:hypothetical protein